MTIATSFYQKGVRTPMDRERRKGIHLYDRDRNLNNSYKIYRSQYTFNILQGSDRYAMETQYLMIDYMEL